MGEHMYLEGLSRVLVGMTKRSSCESIFVDGDDELFYCPPAVGSADDLRTVGTEFPDDDNDLTTVGDDIKRVTKPATANLKDYHSLASVQGVQMLWFELESLLWVLSPKRLYTKVRPSEKHWDASNEASEKFKRQRSLAQYYEAQIRLLAAMCHDQNARCISVVQKMYSYEVIFAVISNDHLPSSTRTVFVELMTHLYVAALPHVPIHTPNTVLVSTDLAHDAILGKNDAESIPQAMPALMGRLRLLKFFSSDYFEASRLTAVETEGEQKFLLAVVNMCKTMTEYGFYGTARGIKDLLINVRTIFRPAFLLSPIFWLMTGFVWYIDSRCFALLIAGICSRKSRKLYFMMDNTRKTHWIILQDTQLQLIHATLSPRSKAAQ
jgi:hypothetical protein